MAQITFTGTDSEFFNNAFFGTIGPSHSAVVSNPTEHHFVHDETGYRTVLTGTGFVYDGDNNISGGTVTGMVFFDPSDVQQATLSGISWTVDQIITAVIAADNDDSGPLAALMGSNWVIDASGADVSGGFGINMFDWPGLMGALNTPGTITGSPGDDVLRGSSGNDAISPGHNNGFDLVMGSAGNDTITYLDSETNYHEIDYRDVAGSISATIDSGANTATVTGSGWTDTIVNIAGPMTSGQGGFGLYGTNQADTFDITSTGWMQVGGGPGVDTFTLNPVGGTVRLDFNWDEGVANGAIVDLQAGTITDDGFGNTETVTIIDSGDSGLQVRGTMMADNITGHDVIYEQFILMGGNDTLDGGGGYSVLRYNQSGARNVVVDLAAGTATGTWFGNAFTHTISNIDEVRGSREDGSHLIGDANDNRLEGYGFDDTLQGGAGNDRLYGGNGNDLLEGGAGNDTITDGRGLDTIDGGAGIDTLYRNYGDDFSDFSFEIVADLSTGQLYDPTAPQFFETLLNLENLDLEGNFHMSLTGDDGNNRLESGGGNDTLIGGLGDDTLEGGDGNDLLFGDDGRDRLRGGAGDDTIDASGGAADQQFFGDIIQAGTGNNTIIGHQAAWELDEGHGLDLLYDNIEGTGGMVIEVGAQGSGTAHSNASAPGAGAGAAVGDLVNDTFTFVDHIEGSQEADLMTSTGDSNMSWIGEGGDDTIHGSATAWDTLGYYWVEVQNQGVVVNLDTGTATDGSGDTDTFTHIDAVDGSRLSDHLTGNDGNNYLAGNEGNDTLNGAGGDDHLSGASGSDLIDGGDGFDRALYRGINRDELLIYEEENGDITVVFGNETDTLRNIEEFEFGDGVVATADIVFDIPPVTETITGTTGNDTLPGTTNPDSIDGGEGDDSLEGGAGDDTLSGGSGRDTLQGGDGNDFLVGGDDESDLADELYGGAGDDSIDGGYGNDRVSGGSGNDSVEGGFGVDTIIGNGGNDVLTGSAFSDLLFGGAGDDFINGGFGSDRVNGGDGADRFFHIGLVGHGSDWIQDYDAAEGDILRYGGSSRNVNDFQVNFANTAGAGDAGTDEAFVIYRPTGQILWALIDGEAQSSINLQLGGTVYDLLA